MKKVGLETSLHWDEKNKLFKVCLKKKKEVFSFYIKLEHYEGFLAFMYKGLKDLKLVLAKKHMEENAKPKNLQSSD